MSQREYVDFAERVERVERDEHEQLVCDLLGEYIARRDRQRLVDITDLLAQAETAGPTSLAALCAAIAFYEHALKTHLTAG